MIACSPKVVVSTSSIDEAYTAESDTVSFVAKALQDSIPEYMAMRSSWEQYQYALQAIDDEEWLLAGHYLDVSLKQLVLEKYDTTYTKYKEVDSLYRREMPVRILFALDEIYPHVAELGKEATTYLKNDISIEGHETLEEDVIDTAELDEIESFLDTLDLKQFSLPVQLNDRVMREIHYLSKAAKSFTEGSLSRKNLYDSLIYAKLKEHQIPEDLIYLALVESGFKVKAYSRAKASGLWQFIPETGKRYGLDVNYWVDMRRNPELATNAAIGYLKRLNNEFNDWLLAMAAYNCGESRVRRLLREMRSDSTFDSTRTITYWDLALPKETMHYVPRILAAMIIGHYPQHYDMVIEPQEKVPFDTITVFDCLPLDLIAKTVGVTEDSIRTLNPELIKSFTPPDIQEYVLKLPFESRERFAMAYEEMDKSQFSRWFHHKVKSGENLGSISRKYGLSIKAIQSSNGMKNTRLRAGQTLLIPLPSVSKKNSSKSTPKPQKVKEYVVKLGDNLASIARQFGVSVENLKSWNKLGDNTIVKVSDTLYVSKPMAKENTIQNQTLIKKYTVKEGDSYHSIALSLGISRNDLMEKNGGMRQRLRVGDEIQIPFPKPKEKAP
ncbi:MAG TPA: LysM peptidoglycan-binding domain-containing protein, partial [Fibrobacteraceae bacterium]|nr:LysM peptidoglycan-binding domain-containing protein [Fibrobacteraceae bacterium]